VLHAFNRRGAFDNLEDSLEALHGVLGSSFDDVEIEVIGSIAVFAASRPRMQSA
jgi:hypothetical protein